MRLTPILALLILLAAVQVNARAGGVGVYLDFGDGRVVWGQVPWHENITAFEATFELLNETGLSWNYSVTQYGVFVNSIGGLENRWPGPWWHLYSLEGGSWSLSQVSCDYRGSTSSSLPPPLSEWKCLSVLRSFADFLGILHRGFDIWTASRCDCTRKARN